MKKLYILGLAAACSLAACKPSLKTGTPVAGTADFKTYISVGNSLTAGYADNSLYRTGQMNSYPQRLSEQFKLVGGGDFKIPLLPGDAGWPSPKLVLANITGCDGIVSLSPIPFSGPTDTAGSGTSVALHSPYNNFGVPGIRCADYLVNYYGALNPYAARFFTNPLGRPLDELAYTVNGLNATFFTLWLGSNDVLGFATAGGVGNAPGTPNPIGLVSTIDISPTDLFQKSYDSVLNVLTRNGAKGVLINIPDITSIPFFTTVPANGLTLRQGQADSLNAAYLAMGISPINVHFVKGQNYFVVEDHDGKIRNAVAGELVLLTAADSISCAGWGSIKPIPNASVITTEEKTSIRNATDAFNTTIQNESIKRKLPIADMHTYISQLSSGLVFNGVRYNASFITGGAFSLDGIHLTPRGYAIVANYIISTINSAYNSTIPAIDINKYSGVKFP